MTNQQQNSTFLNDISNGTRATGLMPPTSSAASSDRYRSMINPLTGNGYSPKYWGLLETRTKLPVWQRKDEFMRLLDEHQCILLEAETGSGKTTQIPQWCLEWLCNKYPNKRGVVCCTQPRRLAAICVAKRVAEEMDVMLGKEVGYSLRHEAAYSFDTRLKYCTDGVLLAESARDERTLDEYDIIVLDEVHERTLTTDVIMGLMKNIMAQRGNNLRVVVMSASISDSGDFRKYFSDFPHHFIKIAGRSHNVDIIHEEWEDVSLSNYLDKAMDKVLQIHGMMHKNDEGDILLFLPGQDDIEEVCEELQEIIARKRIEGNDIEDLECLPFYSAQPAEELYRIFHQRQSKKSANGAILTDCCPDWCYENFLKANSMKFAYDVREQLIGIMKRMHLGIICRPDSTINLQLYTFKILKSIVAGSFMKVAYFKQITTGYTSQARKGHYFTAESIMFQSEQERNGGEFVFAIPHYVHRTSILESRKAYGIKPDWVLYTDAVQLRDKQHYLQTVSYIRPEWLMELAPCYFRQLPESTEFRQRLAEAYNPEILQFAIAE